MGLAIRQPGAIPSPGPEASGPGFFMVLPGLRPNSGGREQRASRKGIRDTKSVSLKVVLDALNARSLRASVESRRGTRRGGLCPLHEKC